MTYDNKKGGGGKVGEKEKRGLERGKKEEKTTLMAYSLLNQLLLLHTE